jgi:hypothetical protein
MNREQAIEAAKDAVKAELEDFPEARQCAWNIAAAAVRAAWPHMERAAAARGEDDGFCPGCGWPNWSVAPCSVCGYGEADQSEADHYRSSAEDEVSP